MDAAGRAELGALGRVFLPAYGGAVGWVLAGCGWGLIIGSALEAAFGRGTDGLLDAAGELSLEAVAGALLGMAGGTLALAGGIILLAAPLLALIGKIDGRYPPGRSGFLCERSFRAGVAAGVVTGVIHGTWLFPALFAAALLESIHGRGVPFTPLQGATLAGILAGGIAGAVSLVRTMWRALPPAWREEIHQEALRPAWQRALQGFPLRQS
jgi:hypothetical protein